jgi:HSP20 family protein
MSTLLSKEERQPLQLSSINISEADQEYILYVATPGKKREDISVSVEKGVVTIVAADKNEGTLPRIKNYWKKTIKLPPNADPLLSAASCINGELQIHIPKGESIDEKPQLIHVY